MESCKNAAHRSHVKKPLGITLRSLSLSLILLFSTTGLEASAIPDNFRIIYAKATNGDKEATGQVFDQLSDLLEQTPDDPLITAYFGSTMTMLGRDAWMPWNKLRHIEKGLASLDKALNLLSRRDYQVPYDGINKGAFTEALAALTFSSVPSFLNRFEQGFEIYQILLSSDQLAGYPFKDTAWVHLSAVEAAINGKRFRQAELWTTDMEHLGPDNPMTDQARNMMKEVMEDAS